MQRVPQPPISPASRAREQHDFWPAFVAVVAALILAICGVRHLTGVDTVDGGTAWEAQLMKAFSTGGLQYPDDVAAPPPPRLDALAEPGEALERWARQQANTPPPTWKVRVDVAAKTPCPT